MTPDSIAKEIQRAIQDLGESIPVMFQAPPEIVVATTGCDVATDVGIRLASKLRVSPADASRMIVDRLPEELRLRMNLSFGFINVSLDEFPFQFRVSESSRKTLIHTIIIPQPSEDFFGWGYCRLFARAWVQLRILDYLKIPAKLVIAGENIHSTQDSPDLLTHLVLRKPAAGSYKNSRDLLIASIEEAATKAVEASGKATVWMPSNYFEQKIFAAKFKFEKKDIAIRSPDRGMLLTIPDQEIGDYFSEVGSTDTMGGLLWYLASNHASIDLDVNIPSFEESANLLWYFSATLARLETRLIAKKNVLSGQGNLLLIEPARVLRSLLGSYYLGLEYAAVDGKVEEVIATLESILVGINKTLNFGLQNEPEVEKLAFWESALKQLLPLKSLFV